MRHDRKPSSIGCVAHPCCHKQSRALDQIAADLPMLEEIRHDRAADGLNRRRSMDTSYATGCARARWPGSGPPARPAAHIRPRRHIRRDTLDRPPTDGGRFAGREPSGFPPRLIRGKSDTLESRGLAGRFLGDRPAGVEKVLVCVSVAATPRSCRSRSRWRQTQNPRGVNLGGLLYRAAIGRPGWAVG
jgi:hypothetical protein